MNNQHLSLYHLGSEYQNLLPRLYDHETGEIDAEVEAQLNALSLTTEKKCLAVASWIQGMEAEKKEIEHLKQQILRREAAYEKEINKAHTYLYDNMKRCGIKEVKSPYFTIKIKTNPYSTEILDQSLVPKQFIKTTTKTVTTESVDKNALKEEVLKTGMQIPGALVQQKTKLEISIDKL